MSELPKLPENATAVQRVAYDALMIQQGACNPSGIAKTIFDSCCTLMAAGELARTHPAIRQMLHQLVYIVFGTGPYPERSAGDDASVPDAYTRWLEDRAACIALLNPPPPPSPTVSVPCAVDQHTECDGNARDMEAKQCSCGCTCHTPEATR